jgi:hypothetical protein
VIDLQYTSRCQLEFTLVENVEVHDLRRAVQSCELQLHQCPSIVHVGTSGRTPTALSPLMSKKHDVKKNPSSWHELRHTRTVSMSAYRSSYYILRMKKDLFACNNIRAIHLIS